jgi:hypothetical protein
MVCFQIRNVLCEATGPGKDPKKRALLFGLVVTFLTIEVLRK